jgi:hypothetical protein
LDTLDVVGSLPERMNVHLDRGYDSEATRGKLKARGLIPITFENSGLACLRECVIMGAVRKSVRARRRGVSSPTLARWGGAAACLAGVSYGAWDLFGRPRHAGGVL